MDSWSLLYDIVILLVASLLLGGVFSRFGQSPLVGSVDIFAELGRAMRRIDLFVPVRLLGFLAIPFPPDEIMPKRRHCRKAAKC